MIKTRWGRARIWAVAAAGASTGLVLAVGAAPAGAVAPRVTFTVNATYACTATVLGSPHTFTSPITLSGKTPASVAPGAKVSMTGWQSKVTIPASLVSTAESYGVTWVSANGFSWLMNASDAKVAGVNVGSGLSIARTNLPKPAANVTVAVPKAVKTVGTWTANAKGTMNFTGGNLKFTLNDNLGVALAVACTPKPVATISHTTVT